MMIVTSALTVALLCLAPSTSHAFVNNQNNGVTSRGEPLSSLVMDRTDVFRPASTHPSTYLPGAPTSSLGLGYGVSSYGPSYGYGYGYGYNSHDYDRYNRYGKYSTYDNARSINDRTYNYNNNYNNYYSPSRYGSTYGSNSWNSGTRRINYAGSNYNGGRSSWDSDVYGSGRNYYNNNYNTGYYNNNYNTGYYNNNYYNNRYNSYNSDPWYSGSSYGSNRYTNGGYSNNYYGPYSSDYYRSGSYYGGNGYNNYGNYNNWNSLSRNNYYGRSSNWATGSGYDLDIDRRGAFEAGSTYSTYNRPSRTALQLQGYGYGSNNWSSDQPRAFNPGYNWRK